MTSLKFLASANGMHLHRDDRCPPISAITLIILITLSIYTGLRQNSKDDQDAQDDQEDHLLRVCAPTWQPVVSITCGLERGNLVLDLCKAPHSIMAGNPGNES